MVRRLLRLVAPVPEHDHLGPFLCGNQTVKLGHVNLNAIEQTRNGGNLASMACGVRKSMSTQVAFILFFRFATFYALERINYATR